MSFLGYIGRTIKRAFLYQALIIFAVYRLLNAYRFFRDFERKTIAMIKSFGLPETIVRWKNVDTLTKEWIYKGFLISLIVLSSLSILGIRFFQFLTGIASILVGFLYFNPIEQLKGEKKNVQDYLPKMEFILYFTLGLAMIAHSFKRCCCCCKKEEVKAEEKEIEMSAKTGGKKKKE